MDLLVSLVATLRAMETVCEPVDIDIRCVRTGMLLKKGVLA
jgi:hypothetical protein